MQFTLLSITNTEQSSVSANRISTIANQQYEEPGSDMTQDSTNRKWLIQPTIHFDKVTLRYESNAAAALKELSLHIRTGERIGIAGRTGSGKSTLLNALFRLADIEQGSINVSGVDINTMARQALRRSMSLIPQEPMLLHSSLREVSAVSELYFGQKLSKAMRTWIPKASLQTSKSGQH